MMYVHIKISINLLLEYLSNKSKQVFKENYIFNTLKSGTPS